MATVNVWLLVIGPLLIGAGFGIWGYPDGNKHVAIWLMGFPGALCLVAALGLELEKIAGESPYADYVFITDGDAAQEPGKPPTVALVLKNTGSQNADDLTWVATFYAGEQNAKSSLDPKAVGTKYTLPPGQTLSYKYTFEKWNPQYDDLMAKNKVWLFAIGEIRYKDPSGASHFQTYKLISGGRFALPQGISPGKWGKAPDDK